MIFKKHDFVIIDVDVVDLYYYGQRKLLFGNETNRIDLIALLL